MPPKLSKMLLPGERVTFGTAVHPVVLVAPLVLIVLIPLALAVALHWTIRHDGVRYPLIPVSWANAALVAAAVPWAFSLMLLIKRAARFWGLRIVATNRRIFAIRGVIVRRITPSGIPRSPHRRSRKASSAACSGTARSICRSLKVRPNASRYARRARTLPRVPGGGKRRRRRHMDAGRPPNDHPVVLSNPRSYSRSREINRSVRLPPPTQ